MAFGILAAFAYYHYRDSGAAILGFCLMIAWHIMDGADGQLARLTNTQSEIGKVLDGICDYVTFIAVYAALAIAMTRQDGAIALIVVILAGACHAAQSAAYEAQRQDYVFWAWGRGTPTRAIDRTANPSGLFGGLLSGYQFLQALVSGNPEFNQQLHAKLAANPASESIRARYRDRFAPAIRHWSILSSNYRTLGIFFAALIGHPLLYFIFEIIGFTPILFILARHQSTRATLFLAEL